jgi:hypothetical protein
VAAPPCRQYNQWAIAAAPGHPLFEGVIDQVVQYMAQEFLQLAREQGAIGKEKWAAAAARGGDLQLTREQGTISEQKWAAAAAYGPPGGHGDA